MCNYRKDGLDGCQSVVVFYEQWLNDKFSTDPEDQLLW
jgi:hypothetical protein